MIIPTHVTNVVENIKKEIQLLLERHGECELEFLAMQFNYSKKLTNIQNKLDLESGLVYTKPSDYFRVFDIMDEIIKLVSEIETDYEEVSGKIWPQVITDYKLSSALQYLAAINPESISDVHFLNHFMEKITYSDSSNFIEFKLSDSTSQFDGTYKNVFPNLNHIQVYSTSSYGGDEFSHKMYYYLKDTLGDVILDTYSEAFEKWFCIGRKTTYYICIP